MALASQSTRGERFSRTATRGRNTIFLVVSGVAFTAILGTAWLLRAASENASGLSFTATASASEFDDHDFDNHELIQTMQASKPSALEQTIASVGQPVDAETPSQEAPKQESPKQEAPKQEAPKQEVPKPDAPQPEQSKPVAPPAAQPSPTTPDAKPAFDNGLAGKPAAQPAAPTAPAGAPQAQLNEGLALAATEPVKARALISKALLSGELGEPETRSASNALAQINAKLFLTPVYNAGDPTCFQYTVVPNDSLEKIVRKNKIGCDWRLVQRINNIRKPEAVQVGKRLKLPKGPFSAVVWKRDYRIDICVGEGADRVVVASMPVGLGEANGTPTGMFRIKPGSKLINPDWTHPVTGEHFDGGNEKNPIGKHWLGLEGMDDRNKSLAGYGIHGTIDPDSIGHDRSLGCVRLLADDIALVWECLGDGAPVEIR